MQKAINTRAREDIQVIHMELGVWKRGLLETDRLFCAQCSQGDLHTDYRGIPCAARASSPPASTMSRVSGHGSTAAPSRKGTALWNRFLPPNLHSARALLYANSCLMVQRLAGDSGRTPGNISGWAGTKTTLTAHQSCTWAWPKPLCFPKHSEEQR